MGYRNISPRLWNHWCLSGGDRIDSTWWSVIVCTLEFHVGYNHKQGTPKNTECRPHRCLTSKV